jgi:hypothetical protein
MSDIHLCTVTDNDGGRKGDEDPVVGELFSNAMS